ncbi:MAG TPA: hypothetical protein VHH72_00630 [Solirubrobacterales bacterium]|jgi:hypothetical protein|nr:hypothetical protein [Solirubrobacterales bacterium]
MRLRLTQESEGTTYLRPWALPVIVAAICVPVVGALALGVITDSGTGFGFAVGALAVATLLVLAARARPRGAIEVASRPDAERRLLVVATTEVTPEAAERIAERAERAADVRLLVPVASGRLSRWLSAEDDARAQSQDVLAHSAGALVAAGLPVSGSLGDSDPAQALEDELRDYSAEEVVLLSAAGDDSLARVADRLELPVSRLTT